MFGMKNEWADKVLSKPTQKTLAFKFMPGDALGVKQYTGFGFKPSGYIIKAWLNDTASGFCASEFFQFGTTHGGRLSYTGTYSGESTRIISVYNTSGSQSTRADHSAFIEDGIEINFTHNSNEVDFLITAFK